MKKPFYLAIGVFLICLAIQCLAVEKFEFYWTQNATIEKTAKDLISEKKPVQGCELIPPEWLPWSLFSPGVLTVLYGMSLDK